MRWRIAIVAMVFWMSVDQERPGKFVRNEECDENLSRLYLKSPAYPIYDWLWNVRGSKTNVSAFEQRPFIYLAAGGDTTRLNIHWDELTALRFVDFEAEFPSLDIYNAQNIIYKFYQQWKPNERFLMEIKGGGMHYIGPAQIVPVQLDGDSETERIVQVQQGWYHTYLFYESTGTNWQFIDQITLSDDRPLEELDCSLSGFVGIPEFCFGSGINILDNQYYTIESGNLVHAFTINDYTFETLLGNTNDYTVVINSESEPLMVNASEIFVEHKIQVERSPTDQDTVIEKIHSDKVSYSLIRQSDGKFRPNKKLDGFNTVYCAEGCDSTHFYPDVYACADLYKLKSKGNKRQKELLQYFEFDSTGVLR